MRILELKEIKCRNCGSVEFLPGELQGVGPNLECKHCGTMYVIEPEHFDRFPGVIERYESGHIMGASLMGYPLNMAPTWENPIYRAGLKQERETAEPEIKRY